MSLYIFHEGNHVKYCYGALSVFVYPSGGIYVYRSDFNWTSDYHEKINRFMFDEGL